MRHMRSVGEEEGGVTAQPKPSKPPILGLLAAQCLGAFNDNVYKMVVSLLAVNAAVSAGGGSGALSLISVIFILPFLSGRIELMLGVLFLMALQATFFSPAKYGILPELLPDKDLSRANGLLEMSTFLAILLGTSLGSMMFVAWKDRLGVIGLILVVISIAGTLASLGIPQVPPSGTSKSFRLNPWAEILSGLRRLSDQRVLWLTVVGISYFWFLGALLQMDILLFGKEVMGLDDLWVGILGTCLAIGIGLGSLMAGRLSGDKVELGLVPLGSIGIGVFSLLLSSSAASYPQTAVALALLGFSGGLFVVPLNAFLQQKSGQGEKGRLIATTNFLNTVGILLASAVLWVLRDRFHLQADWIILILGLFTLLATVYVLRTLPDFLIRFTLWLFTHTVYRIRIVGQEHVPFRGPALLVCNHMSFVDGLLVGACVQRFIRFLIYRPYYEMKSVHWLLRLMKAIPVQGGRPKEVLKSLGRAREALRRGHVVCIFAEGAISRTGNFLPFKRGFERISEGLDVPLIPVHLDQVWGSIFSFKEGRFFWKWPRRIPYPVTVSFGHPLPSTAKAEEVRQAAVVFFLHDRLERPGTHVREGARGEPVTGPLGAKTVPARRDGRTPAPPFGRRCVGQYRRAPGREGPSQSQFHRWAGGRDRGPATVQHTDDPDLPDVSSQNKGGAAGRDGLHRRRDAADLPSAENPDRPHRLAPPLPPAPSSLSPGTAETSRPRHSSLLKWEHRPAEGSHALPPQHPL